jgi:hypothetical protein
MPGPTKITFGEMRESGVRGMLIYCADYHCSHSIAISADHWATAGRLSKRRSSFFGGTGTIRPAAFSSLRACAFIRYR